MSALTSWLDRTYFAAFDKNWDDQMLRESVLRVLRPDSIILDLGAGAGIVTQMDFRGHAARICGIDLDPRVVDNPFIDEGKVTDGRDIPFADATFELVVSDNVLEHLEHPQAVFSEVCRVLKPGGMFLFKTPNKYHYMPIIARITPTKFHGYVNRLRGRAEIDTFPTKYRANCPRDIRDLANKTGFAVGAIELVEGRPEYLRFSFPTYLLGLAYYYLVTRLAVLRPFRILLIGRLIKL